MRYFRLSVVLLFLLSLALCVWTVHEYRQNSNADLPVLTCQEDFLELSVSDGPEALMAGLSAYDKTDGDLTDQILVASVSHVIQPGTVKIKYVVFDSHNNSATVSRKVHYTDYESPRFSLGKAPIYLRGDNFDLLKYITVTDALDGDISHKVKVVSSAVSNYSAGSYPISLEVANSYGDTAQIELRVIYQDKNNARVTITLKDYITYVETGSRFDPMASILSVTDGNGAALNKNAVTIDGNVDTSQPGCYQLTYSYEANGLQGQSCMTVVVTDRED